jgi:hypothetical protein
MKRRPAMNMTQRVYWGFHATMAGVYLSVIGSELAGWYEARDALLLSGLALCGFGLLTWAGRWSTRRRRSLSHEAPGLTRGPSASGLDTNTQIGARRPESYGHLQAAHTRQPGHFDPTVPLLSWPLTSAIENVEKSGGTEAVPDREVLSAMDY